MNAPLLPVYSRYKITPIRGEGVYLYDMNGVRYLDFYAGVAVNLLGHCHPHLVDALNQQSKKLWHVSNLFPIPGQELLGKRLCENSFAEMVFFCNSGSEAIECAVKMARRYHHQEQEQNRYRIICFTNGFHGRTSAAIAAGAAKYRDGFGPSLPGFDAVPLGDLAAVKQAIRDDTAAILLEPIQGEGGIHLASDQFLQDLRQLADHHGLLLIFDEIQCGMGRTGKLFAHQYADITPDIMVLAKGIGGGFPLGACLSTMDSARKMNAGAHGSTFGGNPLAMAVGNGVMDILLSSGFLEAVRDKGAFLHDQLTSLHAEFPDYITDIRGRGLIWGIRFADSIQNSQIVAQCQENGLLVCPAGDNIVRLLPPLLIEKEEIAQGVKILALTCQQMQKGG